MFFDFDYNSKKLIPGASLQIRSMKGGCRTVNGTAMQ